MKIGTKQMAGFLSVAALVAAVGTISYISIHNIDEKMGDIIESAPLVDAAMEMKNSVEADKQSILKIFHAATKKELDQALQSHKENTSTFDIFANGVLNGAETDEGTIYAAKDERLKKIVRDADAFHNDIFGAGITKISALTEKRLELLGVSKKQMRQVEFDYDNIIQKAKEFQNRVSLEISDKLKKGVRERTVIQNESVWKDIALLIENNLSLSRIRIEEYAQNLEAVALEEILEEFEKAVEEFEVLLSALLAGGETHQFTVPKLTQTDLQNMAVNLKELHNNSFQASAFRFIQNQSQLANLAIQQQRLAEETESIGTKMETLLGEIEKGAKKEIDSAAGSAKQVVSGASTEVMGMVVFGLLLALTLGFLISKNITRLLNKLVGNLSNAADQLSAASEEISSSSQQLSQGATEQAASLEETSSSIEQLSGQTKENASSSSNAAKAMKDVANIVVQSARHAKDASQLSSEAKESANKGVKAMGDINSAMKLIREGSDKITDIVEVISDITHQTKMLATNAAIEAARAGDQGKGFAVVADEVSKLAEHSKKAAKEIATLIKDSLKRAHVGSELAENGEAVLKDILEKSVNVADLVNTISKSSLEEEKKVAQVDELMGNIKAASEEQSTGIDQICRVVTDLDKVTQSNAANAEENASASEQLASQAQMLQSLVTDISVHVGAQTSTNGNLMQFQQRAMQREPQQSSREELVRSQIILPEEKGTGKRVSPEAVIPMRDDFKEF